jgi:hypothetical protein
MTQLKNPIQLVTSREIQDREVREAVEEYFQDDIRSSDNYLRFYPIVSSISEKKDKAFAKLFNNWLINEGYYIDDTDKYFHILVRIDW